MGEIDDIRVYHAHIQDLEDEAITIIRNSDLFRNTIDNAGGPVSSISELMIAEGTYQVEIKITNVKNGKITKD